MANYDQDDLDQLTDEERAALLDGGDDEDDSPEPVVAEVDPDKNEEQQQEESQEQEHAADELAAKEEQAPAAAEVKAEEQPKPAPMQPVFVAEAPGDVETKLSALDQRKAEAMAKYNDGVIEFAELTKITDEIAEEKLEIKLAVREADLAAKMAQQQAQNEWYNTANNFANKHGYDANPILYKAFEGVVVSVAQSQDGQTMNAVQILEEAHKQMVAAGLGKAAPAPAAQNAPPAKAKKEQAPQPPNLATVPAAAGTETESGNRFAHLHRLKGDALEDAIMKLSERDREAFLMEG